MIKDRTIHISLKGRSVEVPCLDVEGRTIIIKGRLIRVASVFDDWLDTRGINNPEFIIQILKKNKKADIFTFLESFLRSIDGENNPIWKDLYHVEYISEAVIKVVSFNHWWNYEIKKQTRRRVKKAEEHGISVREVPLDDQLIKGIVRIFNETPIRQGKNFWHFGKSFEQVKKEISTYSDRSFFLGAYWKDELIGFAKLINCIEFGRANQILSMVEHRDKSVNNKLIAELVRICEKYRIPYLKYGDWLENSLGEFKRNNGFKPISIPRYFININLRGKIWLITGIYKGYPDILPDSIHRFGIRLRRFLYQRFSGKF